MSIFSPLKSMPYAQATVKRLPNRVSLVSYTTTVCEIIGGVLVVYGLYSMTTRKHISAFMREFDMDYSIAKACYERGLGFDITTREFVEVKI